MQTTIPYTILCDELAYSKLSHHTPSLTNAGYALRKSDSATLLEMIERNGNDVAVVVLDEHSFAHDDAYRSILEQKPTVQTVLIRDDTTDSPQYEKLSKTHLWMIKDTGEGDELGLILAKACIMHELTKTNEDLRHALGTPLSDTGFVAVSPRMRETLERAQRIAELPGTVLLTGESGTGKTSIAALIHRTSVRKNGPFISVSCAAIPRDLLEAELFGHEKGAFTGAIGSRPGCAELADGGTLFLDEIGDLPLDLQPKLLTFLQDKSVRRVGGIKTLHVDVRIIAATNRDLRQLSAERLFREDLYFRLNVLTLSLPALRERREDIPILARTILDTFSRNVGEGQIRLTKEALDLLMLAPWEGNIRELENTLERAAAFCKGRRICGDDLGGLSSPSSRGLPPLAGFTLAELEWRAIHDTLASCNGDKVAAAKMLGVSVKTIYNKLKLSAGS